MGYFDIRLVTTRHLPIAILILQVLPISGAASNNTRMFKAVKINGGDASCSTQGKNYKSITFSSRLTSATIPCAGICNKEDACVLFDSKGNVCNLYTLTLPAAMPCALGNEGTLAYTKILLGDLALYKRVIYSSTVPDHIAPFSDLTSNKTTYPDYRYCPCTTALANSWIQVDLGRSYKVSRVDVTASFGLREQYFKSVNVHVGETANSYYDPLVYAKGPTPPNPLELVKIDVVGTGRYMTLLQLEASYFCICKIQIYGY
ncbi:uncharacterized protein LOC135213436 [Macrobrachium nipponense]|uniref:uncharacterized protein LOC135213436 n=1 Tax=Macrobrachium nipponense TaxID=159736 RepID=UPI0030C863FE